MRHVTLTCLHHPNLRWHCKSIAVNDIGQYNGARNIFFAGSKARYEASLNAISAWAKDGKPGDTLHMPQQDEPECKCPPSDLRFAPEELERMKTEPLGED